MADMMSVVVHLQSLYQHIERITVYVLDQSFALMSCQNHLFVHCHHSIANSNTGCHSSATFQYDANENPTATIRSDASSDSLSACWIDSAIKNRISKINLYN